MLKKIFGATFIIIALTILFGVITQVPERITKAFNKIDNLDALTQDYVLNNIILLVLAIFLIYLLFNIGIKWIRRY
jgi:hypothetical protein